MVTDRDAGGPLRDGHAPPPLSEQEFREIYAKVPRLTVEVVVRSSQGVLLTERTQGPCAGLWHIPGGTVRFAEPLVAAVRRVAATELGMEVDALGPLLGYIEYPSHHQNGLDSPVGIVFLCSDPVGGTVDPAADVDPAAADAAAVHTGRGWFTTPPGPMHAEQVEFLAAHSLLTVARFLELRPLLPPVPARTARTGRSGAARRPAGDTGAHELQRTVGPN